MRVLAAIALLAMSGVAAAQGPYFTTTQSPVMIKGEKIAGEERSIWVE